MKSYAEKEIKNLINADSHLVARFWAKVAIVEDANSCWEWTASKYQKSGYGAFSPIGNKVVSAHKMAWKLCKSEIPAGLSVLHRCDNKGCCRPSHLLLGTQRDNIIDSISKNRFPAGEGHYHHKLTLEQVGIIRQTTKAKVLTISQLAKAFGVCYGTVLAVLNGRSWNRGNSIDLKKVPKKPPTPAPAENEMEMEFADGGIIESYAPFVVGQ